jgi:hypothetical protein
VNLSYWHHVRRSDLVKLRVAVRQGRIGPAELQGTLAILREVRARPDIRPYLARSLDRFFFDLEGLQAAEVIMGRYGPTVPGVTPGPIGTGPHTT